MIRFKKNFFDPYYKESFYRDLAHKTLGSAVAHLIVACLFAGFLSSLGFYFFQKNSLEGFILSTVDTVSNEYPYTYKASINEKGILSTTINPLYFFKTDTVQDAKVTVKKPSKLVAIDSDYTIAEANVTKYDAYYILLRDGYVVKLTGSTGDYSAFKNFSISRSTLETYMTNLRNAVPLISRLVVAAIFLYLLFVYPLLYLLYAFFIALCMYLVFNFVLKEKISYKSAYIMSIYAGAVTLFLELFFVFTGLPIFPLFTPVTAVLFIFLMHRNAVYFPKVLKRRI